MFSALVLTFSVTCLRTRAWLFQFLLLKVLLFKDLLLFGFFAALPRARGRARTRKGGVLRARNRSHAMEIRATPDATTCELLDWRR